MMADNFFIGGVHSCTHCLRYNPELCIEVWIANGDYSKTQFENHSSNRDSRHYDS